MSKVNINTDRGRYKLRWSFNKQRYSLSIGSLSETSLKVAQAKAKIIESDILFERFDASLAKYTGKYQRIKADNVLGIWQKHKKINAERIAITTQKECWSQVDRCLSKVPKNLLELNKADELVKALLAKYSPGTLRRVLIDINAAVYSATQNNYYSLKKLPRTQKQQIECFNNNEINTIISAFQSNRYQSNYSQFAHDYYTNYVSFLAFTGCRPEEAIALNWSDIDLASKQISFTKAYSKRILKPTKNYSIRHFPVNDQLAEVLDCCSQVNTLVFPSVAGSYINHKTWSSRYWRPIVRSLAGDKIIRKYLKPYTLRHSFITRLIRAGYDTATVGKLAGTSTEMIHKHYLVARNTKDLKLPSI